MNANLTGLSGWLAGSVISFCTTLMAVEDWGRGIFSNVADVDISKRLPKKFS